LFVSFILFYFLAFGEGLPNFALTSKESMRQHLGKTDVKNNMYRKQTVGTRSNGEDE